MPCRGGCQVAPGQVQHEEPIEEPLREAARSPMAASDAVIRSKESVSGSPVRHEVPADRGNCQGLARRNGRRTRRQSPTMTSSEYTASRNTTWLMSRTHTSYNAAKLTEQMGARRETYRPLHGILDRLIYAFGCAEMAA